MSSLAEPAAWGCTAQPSAPFTLSSGGSHYLPVLPILITRLTTKLAFNLLLHAILTFGGRDRPRSLALTNELEADQNHFLTSF